MKVALVCDWLTNVGGAERVLKSISELYPDAPIYTSQYNPKKIDWFKNSDVRTGWLQKLPSSMRRVLGPLRQKYFSQLDLSDYDLVISVTGAEAKAIKTNGTHICYCHVPTQYYHQFYQQYIDDPGFGVLNPIVRFFFKRLVKPLRKADIAAAKGPDYFITISQYAAQQIKEYYNREAVIISPPVAIEKFAKTKLTKATISEPKYFINYSRQVTWKRLDLIIKACLKNKQPLLLIGDGPEHQKLVKLAKKAEFIKFLPNQSTPELKKCLSHAKAFVFPSCEPFGIAPVEALAAGVPVIAYQDGGALDYIHDGKNGLFFAKQSVESLAQALVDFDQLKKPLDPAKIKASAVNYSESKFQQKLKEFIHEKVR